MMEWLGFQTEREAVYYCMGLFTGAAPFLIFYLMRAAMRIERRTADLKRLIAELDRSKP